MGTLVIHSPKHGSYQVLFDDDDEHLINGCTWHIFKKKGSKTPYATATILINKHKTSVYMHRLILKTKLLIDHKNGNGLDNRRSNLRAVTSMQNQQNASTTRFNSSGFKGVTISKYRNTLYYHARIRVDRKLINIGSYVTAKIAAKAYNEMALKHFGEFAKLNPT